MIPPAAAIDTDELRGELEDAIAQYLAPRSRLAPQVEIRDFGEREQHFPSMTTPFRGEIFLTIPRGRVELADELNALVDVICEGFDREEICGERLRAPTCSVRAPFVFAEDRATLTVSAWLDVDVRF